MQIHKGEEICTRSRFSTEKSGAWRKCSRRPRSRRGCTGTPRTIVNTITGHSTLNPGNDGTSTQPKSIRRGGDPMAQRYDTAFKLTLQHVDVVMRELVGLSNSRKF